MTTRTLEYGEIHTLSHALTIAAERFDEHAEEFDKLSAALLAGQNVPMFAPGKPGATAASRLANQFATQAAESRVLRQVLDDAEDVTITTYKEEEA